MPNNNNIAILGVDNNGMIGALPAYDVPYGRSVMFGIFLPYKIYYLFFLFCGFFFFFFFVFLFFFFFFLCVYIYFYSFKIYIIYTYIHSHIYIYTCIYIYITKSKKIVFVGGFYVSHRPACSGYVYTHPTFLYNCPFGVEKNCFLYN